jgi:hypothetical protein
MARILLMISLAAASLAAKDRAWQTGTLLDKSLNPYFRTVDGSADKPHESVSYESFAVAVNVRRSTGDVIIDDYVVEGADTVYLAEGTRFKTFKAAHLSLSLPLTYAVEKNKLYIMDLDKNEYETVILKQLPRKGQKQDDTVAAVEAKPEPAAAPAPPPAKTPAVKAVKAQAKPDPFAGGPAHAPADSVQALVQQAPRTASAAPAPPPQAQPKPEPPVLVAALAPASTPAPKPARKVEAPKVEATVTTPPAKPAPTPKPDPKVEAVVSTPQAKPAPTPKPDPKPAPAKAEAVAKPVKPEPAAKPEPTVSARTSSKDRAWQSGQLLSILNNSYFFNVTYSSDTDGSTWPFVQGSDGRYTVNGQIANPTASLYTYDNYVIESQFCVYLVQRMRPKAAPMVRLPGTKALKFAVEKSKLWVLDEDNIEYETKVVKLVQKDAIVDPLTRAAAR